MGAGDVSRELTEESDPCAVHARLGGSTGRQPRLTACGRRVNGCACRLADALDNTLHVEEVDVARAAAQ